MVVSDGVFSMDGDLAPLDTMSALCQEHTAWLMVDDAHGFGVLGESGAGTLEHFNLDTQCVPLLMGTLGKALGTFGAFVAGSEELIETLIQCSRSYVYTTALPPAVAEATRASLRLVKSESWRRERLGQLIDRFRTAVTQMGLPDGFSHADSADSGRHFGTGSGVERKIGTAGYTGECDKTPTVPEGGARLRITLSAAHSDGHLDRLLEALAGLKCDCPE